MIEDDIELELALARGDGAAWARVLRARYFADPLISALTEMLDPNGDSKLRLEFVPRKRGNPNHGLRKEIKHAWIASRYREELEALKAQGQASPVKIAEDIIMKEFGITDRTVREAVSWAKEESGKVIGD